MNRTTLSLLALALSLPALAWGDADRDGHLNLLVAAPTYSGCADPQYAWIDSSDCADLTSDAIDDPAVIWVVASRNGDFPGGGIGSTEFGISYDAVPVTGWTLCTGGSETPTATWPDSGEGTTITWPGDCYDPVGTNARIGYFTVSDGDTGTISVTVHPVTTTANYIDCSSDTHELCAANLGSDDLSAGTTPECGNYAPAAATDCLASDDNCFQVDLTWTDNSDDETGFYVVRDGARIDTLAANTTAYTDLGAVPGTSYSYTIVAFNECGTADASNADTGILLPVPAAASDCAATDDLCSIVRITWTDNSTHEAGFSVERDLVAIGTTAANATQFDDSTTVAGIPYSYRIVALNSCGAAPPSNTDAGVSDSLSVAASNCSATDAQCASVGVTWTDNSTDETGFIVRRDAAPIDTVAANTISYADVGAVPGTTYLYSIVALNACGQATPSNSDPGVIPVPNAASSCAATDDVCGSLTVTWTDNSTDELGFIILRDAVPIDTTLADVTLYDDMAAIPGTSYSYSIVARGLCVNAAGSNSDQGRNLTVPAAATDCDASDSMCNYVQITWTDSDGLESGFIILRGGAPIDTTAADVTAFDDSTAVPFTDYDYSIVATNACGDATESNSEGGRSRAVPEAASNCLATDAGCDTVHVSWTDNSVGETAFLVKRDGDTIATLGADTTDYADISATPGIVYAYAIVASNSCGDADPSNGDTGWMNSTPEAPTACVATDDLCDLISITWSDNSTIETGFAVHRDGTPIDTTAADITSYDDTGAVPNTSYDYSIVALSACGTSASNTDAGVALTLPPSATNCSASDVLCDVIRITWIDNSPNEDGFKVLRDGSPIATTAPDDTQYDDLGATPGVTYDYSIVATNTCGDAIASNTDTGITNTRPLAASNCFASDGECDTVHVGWADNSDIETGFIIKRDGAPIDTTGPDVVTYDDIPPLPSIPYAYSICALNECGEADPSNVDTGHYVDDAPVAPSECFASGNLCSLVRITWTDNSDNETAFEIRRNDNPLGVAPANTVQYDDSTALPGSDYRYRIVATNSCGSSPSSNEGSGTAIDASPPSATSCIATEDSCSFTRITWEDNSLDEDGFKILRDGVRIFTTNANVVTYDDATGAHGIIYNYTVVTTNSCGDADPSNADAGRRIGERPTAASGCMASDDECGRVHVTWNDNSSNELGFAIRRNGEDTGEVGEDVTEYSDSTAVPGTSYAYSIVAANVCGDGLPSNSDVGLIPVPTAASDCAASDDVCSLVRVVWTDNSDDETGFIVYRDRAPIDTTAAETTDYEDITATADVSYRYSVVAMGACGNSASSNEDFGIIPIPNPASQCAASDDQCDYVRVSWTDESNIETGFIILRDSAPIDTTGQSATHYDDTGTVAGVSHEYAVIAMHPCGNSDPSNTDTGLRAITPISAANCSATDEGCDFIRVTWTDRSNNETAFKVLRDGVFIATTAANVIRFDDFDADPDIVYAYSIVAINNCGEAEPSNTDGGSHADESPAAATECNATDVLCGFVSVTWTDNSSNESGFVVVRNGEAIVTTPANVTTFDDTTATAGGTHVYWVTAYNACGTSTSNLDFGAFVETPPVSASACAASDTLCGRVRVTWSDNSNNESGFNVIRNDSLITIVGGNVTVYEDFEAAKDIVHTYRIVATNGCGDAGASNDDTGLATEAIEVGVPVPISPEPGESVPVMATFSWTPVENAEGYVLSVAPTCYESESATVFEVEGSTVTVDLEGTGLSTFAWWVSALACGARGDSSDCRTATPAILRFLTAFNLADRVVVEWQTFTEHGATGYNVYRRLALGDHSERVNDQLIATGQPHYRVEDTGAEDNTEYLYTLMELTADGREVGLGDVAIRTALIPDAFALGQNVPNPFNPSTTLEFWLPAGERVVLELYDAIGRRVKTLADGRFPAGIHRVRWDGRDEMGRPLASGNYFARLTAGRFTDTRRLTLLK